MRPEGGFIILCGGEGGLLGLGEWDREREVGWKWKKLRLGQVREMPRAGKGGEGW